MKSFSLLLLMCASYVAEAQFFQNIYNFDYATGQFREEYFNSGIRTRDNYQGTSPAKYYYAGVGISLNNPALPAPHNMADRYVFTRTNKTGSKVNNNLGIEFRPTGSGSPFLNAVGKSIAEIDDGAGGGGYYGVGAVYDNSITGASVPGGSDALLVTHSKTGAVTGSWRLDFSGGRDIALCIRKSMAIPGTWLVCGTTSLPAANPTRADCFVARVDALGTVAWAFSFNFDPSSGAVDAACVANQLCEDPVSGMIYVVGWIDDALFMPNINALAFKLSSAGALLAATIYDAGPPGPGATDDRFTCCRFTSDGHIIAGGYSNLSPAGSFAGYKMMIAKLTPTLAPVFNKVLTATTAASAIPSRCEDIVERINKAGAMEYFLFGPAFPTAGPVQCVYKVDALGMGIENYQYNLMKFDHGFGLDQTELGMSKPGLVLFSSIGNTTTSFSDAHLMKSYFNGATCQDICPYNPPVTLSFTYNTPPEEVSLNSVYEIKKVVSKTYDHKAKQICSQKKVSCGSNKRETNDEIPEAITNGLNIYPNPVGDQLTLEWNVTLAGKHTIEILNISGQPVFISQMMFEEGTSHVSIDLQQLTNGTYIIIVRNENEALRKLFIKQ